jgi:hypothetical protein
VKTATKVRGVEVHRASATIIAAHSRGKSVLRGARSLSSGNRWTASAGGSGQVAGGRWPSRKSTHGASQRDAQQRSGSMLSWVDADRRSDHEPVL